LPDWRRLQVSPCLLGLFLDRTWFSPGKVLISGSRAAMRGNGSNSDAKTYVLG
jgi:hypothetical protein